MAEPSQLLSNPTIRFKASEPSGSDTCKLILFPIEGRFAGERAKPQRACRVLDLAILVLVLPVFLVLGAVIAVWIKMVSPGRVLFTQTRIGFKSKPFTIFKFRSMHESAEPRNHQEHVAALANSKATMTKLDEAGDGRLIPWGRCLRRTALDELPQVINILRGEMSIVGPRPCLEYEYLLYDAAQRERFETLPGMTGYWQVNGKNSTTFEEMVKQDIHYVRHRSVWLNLAIILRTPLVIAQQILGCASRVRLPREIAGKGRPEAEASHPEANVARSRGECLTRQENK